MEIKLPGDAITSTENRATTSSATLPRPLFFVNTFSTLTTEDLRLVPLNKHGQAKQGEDDAREEQVKTGEAVEMVKHKNGRRVRI